MKTERVDSSSQQEEVDSLVAQRLKGCGRAVCSFHREGGRIQEGVGFIAGAVGGEGGGD